MRKLLCKIGLHVSDKNYGMIWSNKIPASYCKHCNKQLAHYWPIDLYRPLVDKE